MLTGEALEEENPAELCRINLQLGEGLELLDADWSVQDVLHRHIEDGECILLGRQFRGGIEHLRDFGYFLKKIVFGKKIFSFWSMVRRELIAF